MFTTFVLQVTMLNMLIAIMSDTYSKVSSKREVNSIKTKLEFISDIGSSMLPKKLIPTDECKKNLKLFVIQPAYNFDLKEDPIEKAIATLAKETKAHVQNEMDAMRDDFVIFSRSNNTKIEDIQTTTNIIQGKIKNI